MPRAYTLTPDGQRRLVERITKLNADMDVAFRHPIRLIANALGVPTGLDAGTREGT